MEITIRWEITVVLGLCGKIIVGDLPLVHQRAEKLLLEKHRENSVVHTIHALPENY
jgi:hypothetical protein